MGNHVPREIIFYTKCSLADCTDIRFFSCVNPTVAVQTTLLNKSGSTHLTSVWLHLRVNSLVRSEMRDLLERLFAHIALVRLFASVRSLVDIEVAALDEL